jgi:hypothetical protein
MKKVLAISTLVLGLLFSVNITSSPATHNKQLLACSTVGDPTCTPPGFDNPVRPKPCVDCPIYTPRKANG